MGDAPMDRDISKVVVPRPVLDEPGHPFSTCPDLSLQNRKCSNGPGDPDEGGLLASFGLSGCAHDPYEWFDEHGQCLHSVSIGFLRNARSNGVRYTGEFNIEGFIYTVGSQSIEGLYTEALAKRIRHLQSIDRHQARKRTRCALRFMERYPEADLPLWLASSEN